MSLSIRFPGALRVAVAMLILMVICGGCSAPKRPPAGPPMDEELDLLNQAARLAFEKRRTEQAAELYRKVLQRALVTGDLNAIMDARYNLAVCLMELREYPQALELTGQAQAEMTRTGRYVPADLHLLEATILYRDGQMSRSWEVTDTIIGYTMPRSNALLKKTLFLRGLIAADSGDATRLNAAIEQMGDASDDAMAAERAELIGRLAMIEHKWDQAILSMDEAASLLRRSLDYRRMAIVLGFSADACERSGRLGAAAERYLQAGRSTALEGDASSAEKWLKRAILLSEQSNEPSIALEARDHMHQLAEKQAHEQR